MFDTPTLPLGRAQDAAPPIFAPTPGGKPRLAQFDDQDASALSRAIRRAGQATIECYLGIPTRLANTLHGLGMRSVAEQLLGGLYDCYPFDEPLAMRVGEMRYDNHEKEYPAGTAERGVFLLKTIGRSFPTERLSGAYFHNLEAMLEKRERRAVPGQVVLGLGTGRCGSTSLAAMLASVEDALVTHENPPLLFWEPRQRQVEFHLRRFRLLRQYFPLVADCAHWWLNMLDPFFAAFPTGKAIGLCRDTEATLRSFLKVTAKPRDHNHWVLPHNGLWYSDRWSPTFPQYAPPGDAVDDPAKAKSALIRRYVTEYNERLQTWAARAPGRVLLLRTEELGSPETRRRIADFIGLPPGAREIRLNVGTVADSQSTAFWF